MAQATVEKGSVYRLAGRVGGFARAARYDGLAMTAAARQRFAESFLQGHRCRICPDVTLPADLLPHERERRAEALRKGHYARIALASARARTDKKKAASVRKSETAQEVSSASSTTPTRAA